MREEKKMKSVAFAPGTKETTNEVPIALDVAKTQWYHHFTVIVVAGMGFLTNVYDLFCISLVTKLLLGTDLNSKLDADMKARLSHSSFLRDEFNLVGKSGVSLNKTSYSRVLK